MDIATLGQLIGALGFPIVCCGALFWMQYKNEQSRKEDNANMTEAINNNTIAITQLITMLKK